MIGAIRKGLVAFGRFWWDFLVGDTPGLFLGILALVAVTFALRSTPPAAVIVVPLLAAGLLFATTYRGRVRRSEGDGATGE